MADDMQVFYSESLKSPGIIPHYHNAYEMIFVKEGTAEFVINGKTYNVGASTMAFISIMESHDVNVTSYPYKRYFMLITPSYLKNFAASPVLQSIFIQRPENFRHTVKLDSDLADDLEYHLKNIKSEYRDKDSFYSEAATSCLTKILIGIYRRHPGMFPMQNAGKSTHLISDIQRYIENNYTEDITLEIISKEFFINMNYLSRLFKKHVGINFKDYIILRRIAKAKELLTISDDNITMVAHMSGFNNVNHFIRIFKKYAGFTPYQYRIQYMHDVINIH